MLTTYYTPKALFTIYDFTEGSGTFLQTITDKTMSNMNGHYNKMNVISTEHAMGERINGRLSDAVREAKRLVPHAYKDVPQKERLKYELELLPKPRKEPKSIAIPPFDGECKTWITPTEAAKRMKVSVETICRRIVMKHITFTQPKPNHKRGVLISLEEVEYSFKMLPPRPSCRTDVPNSYDETKYLKSKAKILNLTQS